MGAERRLNTFQPPIRNRRRCRAVHVTGEPMERISIDRPRLIAYRASRANAELSDLKMSCVTTVLRSIPACAVAMAKDRA